MEQQNGLEENMESEKSTLTRDKLVRNKDPRGDLQGNSEKSQPTDETKDDAEACNVFWSIEGGISLVVITSNLGFSSTCRKKKHSQYH